MTARYNEDFLPRCFLGIPATFDTMPREKRASESEMKYVPIAIEHQTYAVHTHTHLGIVVPDMPNISSASNSRQ